MGAGRYRGRVIGQNHDLIIVLCVEIFKDYRHNAAVDKLDRLDLILGLVSVSALIGSLDMDIDKVLTFTPFVDCSVRFALEIRVDIAGRALDFGGVHARTDADTLEQIDCRDDAALHTELLFKGRQSRAASLAPEPD